MERTRIAIVGGGIAGLAAAHAALGIGLRHWAGDSRLEHFEGQEQSQRVLDTGLQIRFLAQAEAAR